MRRRLFSIAAAATVALLTIALNPAPASAAPGDGWYAYQNLESGYSLTAGGSSAGARVNQNFLRWKPDNSGYIPEQDWIMQDSDGDGYYHLRTARGWLAMGVSGGATANSSKVIVWTYNASNTDQQWKPETVPSGVRWRNRKSNRCLAIASPSTSSNGQQAIIYDCGRSGQTWVRFD